MFKKFKEIWKNYVKCKYNYDSLIRMLKKGRFGKIPEGHEEIKKAF